MEDPDDLYKFWGSNEFKAKFSRNTMIVINEGQSNIQFKDGQTISYQYPI